MKICCKCKQEKEINEFSLRKSGKPVSECKICVATRARQHYFVNKENYNERRSKYYHENKEKELKRCKEYYWKNHDKIREKVNEANKSPERREKARVRGLAWAKNNPEKLSKNANKHRKQNPEKYAARQKIFWAVKLGFLIKPKICESCKLEKKVEAHHEDYTKPLEVYWLCKCCHRQQHQGLKICRQQFLQEIPQ